MDLQFVVTEEDCYEFPATFLPELIKGRSVSKILCCHLQQNVGKLIFNDR
jgi:hypothetical protein